MVDRVVMEQATYRMWLEELNAVNPKGRPDWTKRRIAAEAICDLMGISDVIRAIAMDGELRPPPSYPEVDCVPVGGGPGIITCEVRTLHKDRGKIAIPIRLARQGKTFDARQIEEAIERGKYEIEKLLRA